MRLLADENISPLIVQALRDAGHDVLEVRRTCAGCDDETVLQLAAGQGRIVLTADSDFGELVIRQKLTISGVIKLNLHGLSMARRCETILRALEKELDYAGRFTVIEPNRVRQRAI